MQDQIRENLMSEAALDAYGELLDRSSDLVYSMGSLEAISKELSINITDSGLFSISQASDELNTPSILDIIFDTNLDNNLIELVEISNQSAVLIERTDFQEEKVIDLISIKEKVAEDYKMMNSKNSANNFVNSTLSDLDAGEEFGNIAKAINSELESYKGLKRDSSLLTSEAIVNIFNLPRSQARNAYGSSVLKNGDYLIYRLDSVKNNVTEIDPETRKGFVEYLNEEKLLSEYSEVLFAVQENSEVTRTN